MAIIPLMLAGAVFFSCGAKESTYANLGAPNAKMAGDASFNPEGSVKDTLPSVATAGLQERKLVHRATMSFQVEDLGIAEKSVTDGISALGGYVASSSTSGENSMTLQLRVPSGAFKRALAILEPSGKALYRSISSDDVTMQYYDLGNRLENKRVLAARLRDYLKQAKTMEEIMTVETRLNELSNELDALGGEFRNLANLVDFSTIDLTLSLPPHKAKSELSLGQRIEGVVANFGDFMASMVSVLLAFILYGIPVAIVLLVLFWLFFGKIGLLVKAWRFVAKPRKP